MAKSRSNAKTGHLGLEPLYCVDTNVLIHVHRDYPARHFPGLWKRLDEVITQGRLISSYMVFEELKYHEGSVAFAWAKRRKHMFLEIDEDTQGVVTRIMRDYPKRAKRRLGATRADPFVIATAKVRNAIVMTHEDQDHNENRPKIPYVCSQIAIACERFPHLIVAENWVFDCA